jgi:hypothetical protein
MNDKKDAFFFLVGGIEGEQKEKGVKNDKLMLDKKIANHQ